MVAASIINIVIVFSLLENAQKFVFGCKVKQLVSGYRGRRVNPVFYRPVMSSK